MKTYIESSETEKLYLYHSYRIPYIDYYNRKAVYYSHAVFFVVNCFCYLNYNLAHNMATS